MSEQIENVEPQIEGGENLPSSIEENTLDTSKWDVNTLAEEGLLKEGKLFGQYDNIQDLHKGYKELQDKHTAFVREIKEGQKADEQTIEQIQSQREAESTANQVMADLVNQVVAGNEINEEMTAKLEEHNLDVRDLKLNAIEAKESVQKAYDLVGGQEEYTNMQVWAKDALTEAQQADFNKAIAGASAELYIKGLYAEYKASNGEVSEQRENEQTARVAGEPTQSGGIRGYATQAEMLKDTHYINNAGKHDAGARKLYNARMAKTSDEVIYG